MDWAVGSFVVHSFVLILPVHMESTKSRDPEMKVMNITAIAEIQRLLIAP